MIFEKEIMDVNIRGTTLQVADVQLNQGESVYTESGGMAWMSSNIEMDSNMRGGLGGMFGRVFTGESLFMTNYTCSEGVGIVSFCNEFPGKIIPLELDGSKEILCQRDAFMFAEQSIELKTHFRKRLGRGFFGGEGFVLQKIQGTGKAYLELAGEITEYELQEGQTLKVDTGYIAAFESSVNFDITRVKGMKNALFSGEGFFLSTLSGPGKVWLQSMPLSNLASKIRPYISTRK